MNSKERILGITGLIAVIMGAFLPRPYIDFGDFIQGLGVGFLIALAFTVLPKLFKRKNETSTR